MKIKHNQNNSWGKELEMAGMGDMKDFVQGVISGLFTLDEIHTLIGFVQEETSYVNADGTQYDALLKSLYDKLKIMEISKLTDKKGDVIPELKSTLEEEE